MIAPNYKESHSIVQSYQDLYPNILMLEDTDGTAYGLYRYTGYIPLNYVIDHDLWQTVDYRMEGYNDQVIRSHIDGLLSDVVATITADSETYSPGGNLGFDLHYHNWGAATHSVYTTLDVKLPEGGYLNVETSELSLDPGETVTLRQDLTIPGAAPLDSYVMRIRLGLPPNDMWSSDYFDFELVP